MAREKSKEYGHIGPRRATKRFSGYNPADTDYRELHNIGIDITARELGRMMDGIGMDALTPGVLPGSIPTPIQFLQTWLPGFVFVMTGARKIDELVGMSTVGQWEDEEIVQGQMELLGTSVPYGDLTNIPLSSWNVNFNTRTVVRFEEGMRVGVLEEARSSRIQVNSAQMKREAAAQALEIQRNNVGFFGYNAGDNKTYGFLNDPGLAGYTNFPAGASTFTTWATKTYLEILKDIRLAISTLRIQSQDNIDPKAVQLTMALATNVVDYLSTTPDFGNSVQKWLTDTYPNIRVVSAPELNNANGGANVFYLYAENVQDMSTDNGRVFDQFVPTKFRTIGVQQMAKGYEEDYSNAMAGIMVKRPFAVVRFSGN